VDFQQINDLDQLLSRAEEKFEVVFEPVKIGDITLEILQIADLDRYIEHLAETSSERISLPLWSKIWPSSVLLSCQLLSMPGGGDSKTLLELGAGVGLCGLCAASRGYRVTISDNHEDSLLFARINILRNNLQDLARVKKVDFIKDELNESYDLVIGSEILYLENYYPALVAFLKNHLRSGPDAQILLSASSRRKSPAFFQKAGQAFHISYKNVAYAPPSGDKMSSEESEQVTIYRLKAKR